MKLRSYSLLCTAAIIAMPVFADAASFEITNGQTVTSAQTLTTGQTALINLGGTLAVNANNTHSITSSGTGIIISNNGTLNAGGSTSSGSNSGASAIRNLGAGAEITNRGAINTTGFNGEGIYTSGANTIIVNDGDITTNANNSEGIIADTGSNGTRITNNGNILTNATATGILTTGTDSSIINTDSVVTLNGNGIVQFGANSSFLNSGTVSSANGYGIQTLGANSTVTNDGNMSTTGNGSYDIYITGANVNVINTGTLSTTGTSTYNIYSNAAGTVITNDGTISSTGNDGDNIRVGGANAQITNNGDLVATNSLADGIVTDSGATGSIVINNGNISTAGDGANGFYITSNNTTSTNNGTITTTNNNAHAMINSGIGNTATNNGEINTSGIGSKGIENRSANSTILNNGTINTSGTTDAFGMYSTGVTSSLTNNGTINSSGTNADAMKASTSGNTLTNNGTLNVSGTNADGMEVGANNTIINNGTVNVTGSGDALRAAGINSSITNSGYAKSTGAYTVELGGNNNVLTLKASSKIDGNVLFTGSNSSLIYDIADVGRAGTVTQLTGNITGAHTTSITGSMTKGAQVIQQGNTVAIVTPDSFAGTNQAVTQTLTHTSNIITQRQQAVVLGQNVGIADDTQFAANSSTQTDADPAANWGVKQLNVGWVEGFGSYQERPENGAADFSRARSGGLLAGLDLPQTNDGYMSGFYVGGFTGSVDIGTPKFRDIDSNGVLLGGYVGKDIGKYYISTELSAGYSSNDSDRAVGVDIASADYDSYFISPSVTVMRPYKTDSATLVPSATIRYAYQYDDSYSETGSAANQDVDGHGYNSLSARAQIEAQLEYKTMDGDIIKPSFRAGVEGSTYLGDRAVDLTVLGTSTSFDPQGDDNFVDGILGTNIAYVVDNSTELYFDGEVNIGLNKGGPQDNMGGTGRLGAKFKF